MSSSYLQVDFDLCALKLFFEFIYDAQLELTVRKLCQIHIFWQLEKMSHI